MVNEVGHSNCASCTVQYACCMPLPSYPTACLSVRLHGCTARNQVVHVLHRRMQLPVQQPADLDVVLPTLRAAVLITEPHLSTPGGFSLLRNALKVVWMVLIMFWQKTWMHWLQQQLKPLAASSAHCFESRTQADATAQGKLMCGYAGWGVYNTRMRSCCRGCYVVSCAHSGRLHRVTAPCDCTM